MSFKNYNLNFNDLKRIVPRYDVLGDIPGVKIHSTGRISFGEHLTVFFDKSAYVDVFIDEINSVLCLLPGKIKKKWSINIFYRVNKDKTIVSWINCRKGVFLEPIKLPKHPTPLGYKFQGEYLLIDLSTLRNDDDETI